MPEFQPYVLENGEQPIGDEQAYIALFGGVLHEVVGIAPDGHLDTAYGNSAQDAINRAIKAGLKPY